MFIYPYKQGSRSVIALSQNLGVKVIKREGSKFKSSKKKLVVNWGASDLPEEIASNCQILNRPEFVRIASNKRLYFEKVQSMPEDQQPRVPDWTLNKTTAGNWLAEERPPLLFARTVLTGHSGEGIVKIANKEELNKLPENTLIVKYVPKRNEFRVHILHGKVIVVQQKLKDSSVPTDSVDFQIRNHKNGFIFARNELKVPEDVFTQAYKGLEVTGLDFGAVDVIYNERRGEAYVLEVNTAPGLTGSTITDYVNAFSVFKEQDDNLK